jgi:hypothetical protein
MGGGGRWKKQLKLSAASWIFSLNFNFLKGSGKKVGTCIIWVNFREKVFKDCQKLSGNRFTRYSVPSGTLPNYNGELLRNVCKLLKDASTLSERVTNTLGQLLANLPEGCLLPLTLF